MVVGATPAELTARGYLPVGRDFPVFLHPETREEHALARLERKVAPGYRGFTTDFSPEVTLEDDLRRRDLTINAMAQDESGAIIDPHGGRADLDARLLRHVSAGIRRGSGAHPAGRAVRSALRAARLSRRPETRALMRDMVDAGEAAALVPERVWKEMERALGELRPDVFIEVLRDCGALAVVLPEVDALFGVPQPERWHPEIDTGTHLLLALRVAAERGAPLPVRFALLVHDLGKAVTPRERWPSHHGARERRRRRWCARCASACACRSSIATSACWSRASIRTCTAASSCGRRRSSRCWNPATRSGARNGSRICSKPASAMRAGGSGSRTATTRSARGSKRAQAAASAVALGAEDRAGLAGTAIGAKLRDRRLAAITALGRHQQPGG